MAAIRLARINGDRQVPENLQLRSGEQHVHYVARLEVLRRADEPYRNVKLDAHRELRRENGINLDAEEVQQTPTERPHPLAGDRPDQPQRYSSSVRGGEPRAASV